MTTPTVYIRKDIYDAIVSMKQDPSAYVNRQLEATFVKTISYAPTDAIKPTLTNDDEQIVIPDDVYQKPVSKKATKK